MFTGIIQGFGKVIKCDGKTTWIKVPFRRLVRGESISVDGVCLTVASIRGSAVRFDIGPATARLTTLGNLQTGQRVNLERALRVGDPLGGHWVSGHVEAQGKLVKIQPSGKSRFFFIRVPAKFARYIVPKGSVAIEGVSLTVVARRGQTMKIMLIPHTLLHTTLGTKKPGDGVNLETDIFAKYVIRKHS